ncbi:hypothetical protein MW887_008763 [Aspergillus wentii]|nr:hypothetical protein MW887_008763 [Aspergillus wentii]
MEGQKEPLSSALENGDKNAHPITLDKAETARILRKIDWRLLPLLTVLYVLSFLDRGNIGNAKVAGMNEELGLTGAQYNLALTVFFFPYAVFEVPSNVVLKLMRPSIWMCIMMTRMSIFFSAASLAGAFSGLLAFAIEKMDGVGNLSGWRWIFLLEGMLTVVIGLILPWTLPDHPETASFLTSDERKFLRARLDQDSGTAAGTVGTQEKFQWHYLISALTEWKIYLAVTMYWGISICLYGFTYSAPTIIKQLGYSSAQAQLLTIPIYFLGVLSTLLFGFLADKHQSRWPYIIGPFGIALVGFIGLLAIPHPRLPGLTYAFLFCIPAGIYPPVMGTLSWFGNNLAPSWRRAIGMALLISIGNLGGAIGSNIFLEQQKPHYWLGYGICTGITVAAMISVLVLRFSYAKINAERDKLSEAEVLEKYNEAELIRMGDRSPLFRYVV